MKKIISLLVIIVILSVIWKACITVENRKIKDVKPRKFGATYMNLNNPYFDVLNNSIQEELEANGDILISRDPLQNQEKQNAQIEEFIEEKVSAIFLAPVDWKEVKPALEKCAENSIPVFVIDTQVYDYYLTESCIVSDNYNAGEQIAEDMMKKIDSARIVIINHGNIYSTNQRVQGFLDTIKEHPEYKVIINRNTTAELIAGMRVVNTIIDRGIEFEVILGGNDPSALGALAALQQKHVDTPVLIYGIDGSPDGKAMIKEGLIEGSSAQYPYEMGKKAVEVAYSFLKGEKVEKEIVVPVTLITEDNIQEFDNAGWQ